MLMGTLLNLRLKHENGAPWWPRNYGLLEAVFFLQTCANVKVLKIDRYLAKTMTNAGCDVLLTRGLFHIKLLLRWLSKQTCVCAVLEWTGDQKNAIRSALIELQSDDERCALVMLSASKTSTLRTVDLLRYDKLLIWTSDDKQRNYLLIHVPREYDLVSLCNYYVYAH